MSRVLSFPAWEMQETGRLELEQDIRHPLSHLQLISGGEWVVGHRQVAGGG